MENLTFYLFESSETSIIKIMIKSVITKWSGIKIEMISNTKNDLLETNNKFDALEKLSKLKDSGAISDEEFEAEKKELLK